MRKIEHKFDSRPYCCIEQAEHPAAGTACGACTGNALNIAAIVLHDRVCEIRESLIEEFNATLPDVVPWENVSGTRTVTMPTVK